MSFHGPQQRGAMRTHRELLREEAQERQATYDQHVRQFAADNGMRDLDEARAAIQRDRRDGRQLVAALKAVA